MKIFISYRRADTGYLVGRIKDRLVGAFGEQTVFRDLDDIPAGVDFRTVLEEKTNECSVMLVVIGPQWAAISKPAGDKRLFDPEDYTRIEVETGLKRLARNESAVFPVLVMNAAMPAPQELPSSLEPLTYQNAINIRNDPDFNNDIEKLIRDIRRSLGNKIQAIPVEYFEPETIFIPEGAFWMGSDALEGIPAHETPCHEVFLPAYRIGKYPVTNAQYEEFIRQTGRLVQSSLGWDGQRVPPGLENHPVAGITFYDALAYCQWLSAATSRNYAIPNEAQWEKACRGGNRYLYPWGDGYDSRRCNHGRPAYARVDAYPAQNEYACFDLVGNVRQWTATLWGEKRLLPDPGFSYPWQDDRRNDLNANRQVRRVVRGSSMKDAQGMLRCSARSGQLPDDPGLPEARHGLRVVMFL